MAKPGSLLDRLPLPWRRRRPVIPAVRLQGVIGQIGWRNGLTLAGIGPSLERAFAVPGAPAVALLINSPGGSPVQSALIGRHIRRLAEEKQRPVLAFVEDVAASGGYWLACAADEIHADASSVIGSIGVISASFGFVEAIHRLGIERRVHASGASKSLLDPFQPEKPRDLEVLAEVQDDIFRQFQAHVRARRGARLKEEGTDLFDGRVWSGEAALGLGLVDGLGDATGIVRQRFGKEAQLKPMNPAPGWLQRRLGRSMLAGAAAEIAGTLEERVLWQRYGL